MKQGIVKHPYLGSIKAQMASTGPTLILKTTMEQNPTWFANYNTHQNYSWKFCLFPKQIKEEQDTMIIPKKNPTQEIIYKGYFITSLTEELTTRGLNKARFSDSEILYILYTIVCAWREWKEFCRRYEIKDTFTAISSNHILFNEDGQIKLITPISSPLQRPSSVYFAPQNLPPTTETDSSWNKSITFSLGLIGAELISMRTMQAYYKSKGTQLIFDHETFRKELENYANCVGKQVYNLVVMLTHPNPWVRIRFGEFEALLAPYSQTILEGKQSALDESKSRASLLHYLKSHKNMSII